MDWNNDGKKDLLTGENSGHIRLYLNTNTDDDPVFSGYTRIMVGLVNFDCGSYSMPYVTDWNSDGKKDLVCGEGNGKVYLLLNTNTDDDPRFDQAVFIKNGAIDIDVGSRAAPATGDWNRDGLLDLLVGETYGRIYYYENVGTAEAPAFSGYQMLTVGGSPLDVKNYSRFVVVDWDGDGVLDILSGNRDYDGPPYPTGGVILFRSRGPLQLSDNAMSAASGGIIYLTIRSGAANNGRTYFILGSMSGTDPGTPLPGGLATIPLNWDWYTDLVLDLVNTPFFESFMGAVDELGRAEAVLNIPGPLPPELVGTHMAYAYTFPDPFDYVSNGAKIEFIP